MEKQRQQISIIIYSNADPEGCVRLLTDCERLEHADLDFEVILVLQGLTQKVTSMLEEYKFPFQLKFVPVEIDTNRARGRNLGVAAAKYPIILLLDSSLEVSPELLHRHLEAYGDPKTAAVMGEIFLPEFVKKSRWLRFLDSNYHSTRRWAAQAEPGTSPPLRYINTSNFSIQKYLYLRCNGHNEAIGNHEAENIDLAYRISALKEGLIRYEPEAVAFCQHAPFKASLQAKYEFGSEGIPKLLAAYPDLYPVLPSRFVKLDGFRITKPIFRWFMNLFFTSPVLFAARGLRLVSPEFIAFRILRYMLQYESVKGVKRALGGR